MHATHQNSRQKKHTVFCLTATGKHTGPTIHDFLLSPCDSEPPDGSKYTNDKSLQILSHSRVDYFCIFYYTLRVCPPYNENKVYTAGVVHLFVSLC